MVTSGLKLAVAVAVVVVCLVGVVITASVFIAQSLSSINQYSLMLPHFYQIVIRFIWSVLVRLISTHFCCKCTHGVSALCAYPTCRHQEYIVDDVTYMRLKFYVDGSKRKGTATIDLKKVWL